MLELHEQKAKPFLILSYFSKTWDLFQENRAYNGKAVNEGEVI